MKLPTLKIKTLLAVSLVVFTSQPNAQNILAWTEQNSTLGLGYPVPIPVNTPEPFDGFRSYSGLFAKHQMMALDNDYITGHIVGQTHYNRDIWAYLLSDEDNITKYGVKEGALMINGGIHAREWQTPETLTQIITAFHENADDASFYQFLLENTSIITIPSNNIDGFLQTQRFPTQNWYSNNLGPRDGRMRRKNLLNTDEVLITRNDFLNGVDLNRNNNPYWATSDRSSSDPRSIVHHGPFTQSEPETTARLTAAELVDADQLRMYTDVHSFSQVHFSVNTFNQNRNELQRRVLRDFTDHHRSLPGAKNYVDVPNQAGRGIGATDGYFAYTYEIPSWTLEIEPSGFLSPDAHPNLPGVGADYGGFANNGHDGFILPESEIKRVREQLTESFMVAWYGQAGPPSITQFRVIDHDTGAIVYDAEWDISENNERELYSQYFDEITPDKNYSLLVRFDKPMRYRDSTGEVSHLQGQNNALIPQIQASINDNPIGSSFENPRWINTQNNSWESYGFYKDDTFVVDFTINGNDLSTDQTQVNWQISTTDMIGQNLDGDPSTVITWSEGQWQNYEDSNSNTSINGGMDSTLSLTVNQSDNNELFARLPDTALYYDPNRSGEGFSIEFLNSEQDIWMQWFTYDEQGQQQWYVNTGQAVAENAIQANSIYTVNGGTFGDDFDPAATSFEVAGDIEVIFNQGEPISEPWLTTLRQGALKYTYPDGRKFRAQLQPLTAPVGFGDGGLFTNSPRPPFYNEDFTAGNTGSWYNPERSGEGYHIQILNNQTASFQWYGFGLNGEKMWFIGDGGIVTTTETGASIQFDQVYFAEGGVFGSEFDPSQVSRTIWGTVTLELNCLSGSISYASELPGYGSATYDIVPLTRPQANFFDCSRIPQVQPN